MTAALRLLLGAFLAITFSAIFPAHVYAQRVAIVAADSDFNISDVHSKLTAAGLTDVAVINASTQPTPSLQDLQQFDVVLTWANMAFQSPEALGNVFADYVDAAAACPGCARIFAEPCCASGAGGKRADTTRHDSGSPWRRDGLVAINPSHPILRCGGVQRRRTELSSPAGGAWLRRSRGHMDQRPAAVGCAHGPLGGRSSV